MYAETCKCELHQITISKEKQLQLIRSTLLKMSLKFGNPEINIL